MSKSPDIVERLRAWESHKVPIEYLREAADEIDLLRHDVATLRAMHQSYRDEIVEHLREIERLKAEIKQRKYRTVDWLFD